MPCKFVGLSGWQNAFVNVIEGQNNPGVMCCMEVMFFLCYLVMLETTLFPAFLFMLMRCKFREKNLIWIDFGNLMLIKFSAFVILPPNGCSKSTINFLYLGYLNDLLFQREFFIKIRTESPDPCFLFCNSLVLPPQINSVGFLIIHFVHLSCQVNMTVMKFNIMKNTPRDLKN